MYLLVALLIIASVYFVYLCYQCRDVEKVAKESYRYYVYTGPGPYGYYGLGGLYGKPTTLGNYLYNPNAYCNAYPWDPLCNKTYMPVYPWYSRHRRWRRKHNKND